MLDIRKPVLLVDEQKVRRNIARMAERAAKNNVHFRPHFKTHQSAHIGEWFREMGIQHITASSVSMAAYFADNGWEDITVAFPVNLREIDEIRALAARVSLGLLVDSVEVLSRLASLIKQPVKIWLAVNAGLDREGLAWKAPDPFERLILEARKSPYLDLTGLLTHFGQTYNVQGKAAVNEIFKASLARMMELKDELRVRTGTELEISIGDTPGCSLVDDFSEVDEIRPGNFVFFDIHQLHIGACQETDIAAGVACPVVSVYPERQTILIYGGAVHLSKDFLPGPNSSRIYGKAARLHEGGWGEILPDTNLYSLSQEHGLIRTIPENCEQIHPSDILVVLPAHVCLSVSALHRYLTLDNKGFSSFVE